MAVYQLQGVVDMLNNYSFVAADRAKKTNEDSVVLDRQFWL